MKWITNGIEFRRGCDESLIARYDGAGCWWELGALTTQQTMKAEFRRLGKYLGASRCEVKKRYDEDYNQMEFDIVYFRFTNGCFRVGFERLPSYFKLDLEGCWTEIGTRETAIRQIDELAKKWEED